MRLAQRYARKIDRDQWDTDSGTIHIDGQCGTTLCGYAIGTIRDGWERFQGTFQPGAMRVKTCARCEKKA